MSLKRDRINKCISMYIGKRRVLTLLITIPSIHGRIDSEFLLNKNVASVYNHGHPCPF